MSTEVGKLMPTVMPQTRKVLKTALGIRPLSKATRQLPSPHSRGPKNISGAVLKLRMSSKKTG